MRAQVCGESSGRKYNIGRRAAGGEIIIGNGEKIMLYYTKGAVAECIIHVKDLFST